MEGGKMKNVIYSKKDLTHHRGRAISVREKADDKQCDTSIRKSFVYLVHRADTIPDKIPAPEVRVIKVIDSVSQREIFFLRVKGTVYFKQNRFIHRVDYMHSLLVRMLWKSHVLSSDSATFA